MTRAFEPVAAESVFGTSPCASSWGGYARHKPSGRYANRFCTKLAPMILIGMLVKA